MKKKSSVARDLLEKDPYLKKTADAIVEHYKPIAIYLFGSKARGDAGPNSDYDLLVIVEQKVDRKHRAKFHDLRWKVGLTKAIDVVLFTQKGFEARLDVKASLPATVREEGKLLYGVFP